MTSALEQSFKKRLQLIVKERKVTPAEVWQNVITETIGLNSSTSGYLFKFLRHSMRRDLFEVFV